MIVSAKFDIVAPPQFSDRGSILKNHHKIKLIAASVALTASFGVSAGLGGLNVQSRLGEPFSGSITVTGDEAKALLEGSKASVSNSGLRTSVRKSGDKAVLNIRSARPIHDPVLIFQVGVGSQSREYTAIIDPAGYNGRSDGAARPADSAAGRSESVQPSAQQARERVTRPAPEPARRATAERKAANAAKPKTRQSDNAPVYGRRHLVRQGETLTGIASRIRPQGMTLAQTMQALVNANPDVFVGNDADRMLAGKILDIPPRAKLQQLAAQTPSVRVPSEQIAHDSAADKADSPVAVPASAPQSAASGPTADDRVDAAAAASEAAVPTTTASDNATPAAASAATASGAPVVQNTQASAEDSADSGLWRWLLLGGAALIAAYLLAKLLGRKKAEKETEEIFPEPVIDELPPNSPVLDEPRFEEREPVFGEKSPSMTQTAALGSAAAATAATAASRQYKPADDELDIEDDFGDDIFFTDVEEVPAVSRGDVKVDLNAIDNAQGGIPSGAVTRDAETEKRREADWDAIESTESVYEPEPENPYDFSAGQASVQQLKDVQAEDFGLRNTQSEFLTAENDRPSESKQAEEAWDFFAEDTPDARSVAPAPLPETSLPDVSKAAAEGEPERVQDAPLEFSLGEDSVSSDAPVEASAVEEGIFDTRENDSLSLQDSQDLSIEAQPVNQAVETETLDWADITVDDIADGRGEAGFISEAVGMTAPLEAKYELAKMYVEIGDPEAAKETLQQLLEESDGAILAKAKAMLQDLGA